VAIEVWDTGIGIHPDHQRAIFGEFFQVGNPERDRRQGLGLGLAIVDRIARLIGATVAVRSVPGKGSCFSVLLPPQPGPPILLGSGAPRDGGVSLPADLEGRLVVVVENEEEIRSGICALLEGWGCEVLARASGADVAERIDSLDRSIDAIVSDYGLAGGENGIDVIHTLRRLLGYECPALLITGDTSPVVLQAAHGADLQVLHKPVRPAQLRQVLASLIGN
jgi:signal transduction histidine kinase